MRASLSGQSAYRAPSQIDVPSSGEGAEAEPGRAEHAVARLEIGDPRADVLDQAGEVRTENRLPRFRYA